MESGGHWPRDRDLFGKGMYWDNQGVFVGQGAPERMFVDWDVFSSTGGGAT